ncbi:hypothetical protein [Rhodopseudomonas telluris]|uniref:Uncharacterized protein n=1 Tax=Rhodopseudomonas telluris TaxID=644215 RepID=A0ABV6ETQ2_9BRAD
MTFAEPPSRSSSIVLIGKNSRGQWVAQHRDGLYGGLFTHHGDAVRYALFENGHHPEAVITIGCVLELNMTTAPSAAQAVPPLSAEASRHAA